MQFERSQTGRSISLCTETHGAPAQRQSGEQPPSGHPYSHHFEFHAFLSLKPCHYRSARRIVWSNCGVIHDTIKIHACKEEGHWNLKTQPMSTMSTCDCGQVSCPSIGRKTKLRSRGACYDPLGVNFAENVAEHTHDKNLTCKLDV